MTKNKWYRVLGFVMIPLGIFLTIAAFKAQGKPVNGIPWVKFGPVGLMLIIGGVGLCSSRTRSSSSEPDGEAVQLRPPPTIVPCSLVVLNHFRRRRNNRHRQPSSVKAKEVGSGTTTTHITALSGGVCASGKGSL